jgi:hypothetical protein
MLTDPSDNEQMMQLLVLLQDAARGIAALHSKSVVHGDGEQTAFCFMTFNAGAPAHSDLL